ncbi:hypothetical protein C0J52_24986 [Blattella germanica]|nr:hypothetical protein C0J52_24986 [Blattella germanica]
MNKYNVTRLFQVDGHGVDTGPDLDEEMEKVFVMAEDERFDVSKFAASPDSNSSKRSFNEKDYSREKVLSGTASPEDEREEQILSSESEPQVSERAANYSESPVFGSPDPSRRVQFQIGELPKTLPEDKSAEAEEAAAEEAERKDSLVTDPFMTSDPEEKKSKRKHSRHHYHRRKYSLQEGSGYRGRVRAGSDFGVGSVRRISIQPEEASMLQEQDIDDLTSKCDTLSGNIYLI